MGNDKVIIIGAGLAGSLLSTYLAKRGIETDVYEARADMRSEQISAGRSINLALSNRGIRALKEVGLADFMLEEAVPMYGRMIHAESGEQKLLPYSGREGEFINSISRGGLNIALINEADKYERSRFHFNKKCIDFNCETGGALIKDTISGEEFLAKGDTVIATDGAGSAVRRAFLMNHGIERFNFSQAWLKHGYKELSIAPRSEFTGDPSSIEHTGESEFLIEKNALHIWARHQFMMIALPNFDGSFTVTLFLSFAGENSFEAIANGEYGDGTKDSVTSFFEANFPDALALMPELAKEFAENPTGNLGTIKCYPWHLDGKALLLGDAAHAVVPFYGQGMNASFEDCRILNELIDRHETNWQQVFSAFSNARKINADAIADMAVENFYEMRDAVTDPVFQRKRALEMRLEQEFPGYFSKYSLVTFREDIPYSEAMRRGNAQDALLMKLCENEDKFNRLNLNEVFDKTHFI